MEKEAKASTSKLPELRVFPFTGTSADWIRFESMFVSQVDSKPISDAEKFGYLLEFVHPKVRADCPTSQDLRVTRQHGRG